MKRTIVFGLMLAGLARAAWGQPMEYWVNDGIITCPPDIPPQVDAINVVNNNTIIINVTNFMVNSGLWDTSDTLNFTNIGSMTGSPGFQFDTAPANIGLRQRAASIVNSGTITVGTSTNYIVGFTANNIAVIANLSKFIGNATNIVNPGSINIAFEGLCELSGESVDMSRGALIMGDTGFDVYNGSYYYNGGIFDGYWGLTNSVFNPAANFGGYPARTPSHPVTDRRYLTTNRQLGGSTNQLAYVAEDYDLLNNIHYVRAAFLQGTNSTITANVYFPPVRAFYADIIVEWGAVVTNNPTMVITNYIYLFDNYLNLAFTPPEPFGHDLLVNGFVGILPTYVPHSLLGPFLPGFFRGGFYETPTPYGLLGYFGQSAIPNKGVRFGLFNSSNTTNQFGAYEGIFDPASALTSDIGGGNITNLPGRIRITADKVMDLTRARISSLNYLGITSTNHYVGSSYATISAPYVDINVRSTNGLLTITNTLSPALNHAEGIIDCYSCRWTNIDNAFTNIYHVLFADASLSPYAPSRVQNLTLRSVGQPGQSDAIVINDMLNILSNSFTIETCRLTLDTNAPGSPTPYGAINLLSSSVVWSTATPRLQYLTNNGFIQTLSAMFFGGSRSSPYYNSNYNEPYYTFVNRGGVTNFGSLIWATNFENSGTFHARSGRIDLQKAQCARLTDGLFFAPAAGGLINIESANLFVSNHVMQANGSLTLAITNALDDGSLAANSADGITNKNFWTVNDGFNLLAAPTRGSLLGTTISNIAPDYHKVVNRWAGADLGCSPAGFSSNSAIGHLILDGGLDPLFVFSGTGVSNALYVDCLEFRNRVATNVDRFGNFLCVSNDWNMKIYYGQALANGQSIAEKLAQVNGGRFIWVSNYNTGFFSSTNVAYPDGTIHRLNTALVTSCDIDSNGNGVPNCVDPAPVPILSTANVTLSVGVTNQPAFAALVSWSAFPGTTNFLLSASSPYSTNWQVVTNFVFSGPVPGRVTVADVIKTNGPRFYRVRVHTP